VCKYFVNILGKLLTIISPVCKKFVYILGEFLKMSFKNLQTITKSQKC